MAELYRKRWRVGLCATSADGAVAFEMSAGAWSGEEFQEARKLAIAEALRWGEPCVEPAPRETIVWAAPILHNARLLGGLVAGITEKRLFPRGTQSPLLDIRAACADLLRLAEEQNLTNAALLESRRREYQRERVRAEAIHAFKGTEHYDMRTLYLLEEPALIGAIRKGDRGQARAILNRLLVGMIHRAGSRLELVKSFFMELVAMMSRTAVEAGGLPEELLGTNYDGIARLAAIDNDEQLAPWLHEMLERILDSMRRNRVAAQSVLMASAMKFMSEHCCEDISRDDVAAAAEMSGAHFSRSFRKQFGRTFTDLLSQMRTERAADLLARTDRPLKLIALQCGFTDQSYLTKVFRRRYRVTPAMYRREHEGRRE